MRPYVVLVLVLLSALAGGMMGVGLMGLIRPGLPRCNEDEVLVGRGDFVHGHWSAYDCGPAIDDLWDGAPR